MTTGGTMRKVAWGVAFTGFTVATFVALFGIDLLEVVTDEGFLPPDEFPPARYLTDHLYISHLIVQAGLLFYTLGGLVLVRGSGLGGTVGLVVGLAGMIVLQFSGLGAIIAILGLFMVFLDDASRRLRHHPDEEVLRRAVRAFAECRIQWRSSILLEALGVPAIAGALVCGAEVVIYTNPHTASLVGLPRGEYWAMVLSAGALAGARFGLELLLVMLLARRLMWNGGAGRLIVLPLLTAFYIYGRNLIGGYAAVGPSMSEVGTTYLIHVLFGSIALLFGIWTQHGLEQAVVEHRPERPEHMVEALLQSVLSPFGRPRLLTALFFAALVFYGLTITTYMPFRDYSEVGQPGYTPMMLLAAITFSLTLYLAMGRPLQGRVGGLLLAVILAGAMAGTLTFQGRPATRELAHQYSELGWQSLREIGAIRPLRLDTATATPVEPEHPETLPAAPPGFPDRPPIIVILWDAARADHMGFMGAKNDTAPYLAKLAQEGVVFDEAYANATATTASLRHLFTGLASGRYARDHSHGPFFTGRLATAGYTDLFINIVGSELNGVGPEAFYRNQPNPAVNQAAMVPFSTYPTDEKVQEALRLLDTRRSDHFFMYLHMLDSHYPWQHHAEVPSFGDDWPSMYDESIAYSDYWTHRFFEGLRKRGLYDKAVIVVTADHGTGLMDHGFFGTYFAYQEQIHVPLVIKIPGVKPAHVSTPVAGIDLAPTLVGLVQPNTPNPFHGVSLLPAMTGAPIDRRYIFHTFAFEDGLAVTDILTDHRLFLFRDTGYATLYDRGADPGEKHNLAEDQPDEVARLTEVIRHYLALGYGTWDIPRLYGR